MFGNIDYKTKYIAKTKEIGNRYPEIGLENKKQNVV